MARFPSKFADYKILRDEGKSPDEIIESGFCSRATANRHERSMERPIEIAKAPDGIRTEPFGDKKNKKPTPRTKNAPITEATAGMILQGLSEIGAFLAAEQELALTEEERGVLEGPFTESLALLPSELSKGINKYAAPGMFVTQFVAIYARKMQRIALKRAGVKITQQRQAPAVQEYERTNMEAVRQAAAAVAAAAAASTTNTNGKAPAAAPSESSGVLEPEHVTDRKTEFET